MASSSKKYFWLRLKDDFFKQKEMKKLRKIAGGDTYTIIYLKLMLLSMKTDGILEYTGLEDTMAEELALEIDEDEDNVLVTLNFLTKAGLMEILDKDEIFLNKVPELTGKESESAERVRKCREKKKLALQCNNDVTKSNTEIEIKIEKEIKKEIEDKSVGQEFYSSVKEFAELIQQQFEKTLYPTDIDKMVVLSKQYDVNLLEVYNKSSFLRGLTEKKPTLAMFTSKLESTIQKIKQGQYVDFKNDKGSKKEFEFDKKRYEYLKAEGEEFLTGKDLEYLKQCKEYLEG